MEKKERSRPSGKTQGKPEKLTSVNGRPIADNEDSQTAGLRGPIVLQDPWMLEKLAHFDREVIPERRMHAKGSGAYGTFTVTHDITRYTRASIFSRIGKQTECFVRFSTVAGERGAADAERDIRGFAMKFYTDAGNWDLVGNNTPVFFLRDPGDLFFKLLIPVQEVKALFAYPGRPSADPARTAFHDRTSQLTLRCADQAPTLAVGHPRLFACFPYRPQGLYLL